MEELCLLCSYYDFKARRVYKYCDACFARRQEEEKKELAAAKKFEAAINATNKRHSGALKKLADS